MNPVHTFPSYFTKINFNIVLLSTPCETSEFRNLFPNVGPVNFSVLTSGVKNGRSVKPTIHFLIGRD